MVISYSDALKVLETLDIEYKETSSLDIKSFTISNNNRDLRFEFTPSDETLKGLNVFRKFSNENVYYSSNGEHLHIPNNEYGKKITTFRIYSTDKRYDIHLKKFIGGKEKFFFTKEFKNDK